MKTQTSESQSKLNPSDVLDILKEGNKRFVSNNLIQKDFKPQVKTTSGGQFPFAVIISCIDSRVPPEIIFDQGIGDVFSIRVAGNVINTDVLGSVEFACKLAGVKLIVVLGHTSCGAVKGACNEVELGNLTGLLNKIKPAIRTVSYRGEWIGTNWWKTIPFKESCNKSRYVDEVALENVRRSLNTILCDSPIVNKMVNNNEVECAAGMYSVETGEVEFYPASYFDNEPIRPVKDTTRFSG